MRHPSPSPAPEPSADQPSRAMQARRLRFLDPQVEAAFRADYFAGVIAAVRINMLFGGVLIAVGILIDRVLIPQALWFTVPIRLGVACPAMLGIALLSLSRRFERAMGPALVAVDLLCGLMVVAIIIVAGPDGHRYYYAGIILATIGCCASPGLRFRSAAAVSLATLLAYEATLWSVATPQVILNNSMFLLTAEILALNISYTLECQRRSDFLQRLVIREQSEALGAMLSEAERAASTDSLTGLSNRSLLLQDVERAIVSARDGGGSFALLLLDLDRFKEINDTFGHHFGDAVLQRLRPILLAAVRESDTVARLGGDEFGILLPASDRPRAAAVAGRILSALRQPFVVDGQPLDVDCSIGIVVHPEHGRDTVTLLKRADVAMYAAKRERAGRAFYTAEDAEYTARHLALAGELRQGIDRDQLLLHYQPKIDLRTMRVGGVEALVRWLHPREGLIPPGDFIPLAEHTGLIKPLGLWTLNAAMRQCRAWHMAGLELNVAVNLAPENLRDAPLLESVIDFLASSDARPEWLTVEVTESAMMADPARMKAVLTRLHDLGMRISVDDFGTGYSSLAYLRDLPVDEVKVDRSFVRDLTADGPNACIVRAVIDLGHNLGLRVVAEGVEDEATLALLSSWGCDVAQGYYFSPPLPPVELLGWLSAPSNTYVASGCDARPRRGLPTSRWSPRGLTCATGSGDRPGTAPAPIA